MIYIYIHSVCYFVDLNVLFEFGARFHYTQTKVQQHSLLILIAPSKVDTYIYIYTQNSNIAQYWRHTTNPKQSWKLHSVTTNHTHTINDTNRKCFNSRKCCLMMVCSRILAVQVVQFSHFISHLEPKQSCAFWCILCVEFDAIVSRKCINLFEWLQQRLCANGLVWQHQATLPIAAASFIFPKTFKPKEAYI